jgi:hypothetical protein
MIGNALAVPTMSAVESTAAVASSIAASRRSSRTAAVAIPRPVTIARAGIVSTSIARTAIVAAAVIAPPVVAIPVVAIMVALAIIATAIKSASVISAIPGTRTNEHAPDKVVWSVIPVRSARIGIVIVVTVSADGRRPVGFINRAYADSERNLRPSAPRCKQQNTQQANEFYVAHALTFFRPEIGVVPRSAGIAPGEIAWGSHRQLVKHGSAGRVTHAS